MLLHTVLGFITSKTKNPPFMEDFKYDPYASLFESLRVTAVKT
jgi:hypothetical protein